MVFPLYEVCALPLIVTFWQKTELKTISKKPKYVCLRVIVI